MTETNEESYYDILGVNKNASFEEIKKKRRDLSVKYHPDKLSHDKKEWGTKMITKLNEAYEVLSNPEKRELYDKYGKDGLSEKFRFNQNHGFNPNDIIENMFNPRQKQRDRTIHITINVTLEDIFNGKDISHEIERETLCVGCDNTGFMDKKKHTCSKCGGSGIKIDRIPIGPGMIQTIKNMCNMCHGTGNSIDLSNKCKICNGNAFIKEKKTLKCKVEPGMCKGDAVIMKNEGHEIPKDMSGKFKRGDVAFIIHEIPHETFKRGVMFNNQVNPANIIMEIELELYEALCGFTKKITYLDGSEIYIDHYDVIKDSNIKVIENKGLPYKGQSYKNGDLFIKFKVKYPSELTDPIKSKLYELLTHKKFNTSTVHKIPDDKHAFELKDIQDYTGENYEEDDEGDQQEGGGVQCAQQ